MQKHSWDGTWTWEKVDDPYFKLKPILVLAVQTPGLSQSNTSSLFKVTSIPVWTITQRIYLEHIKFTLTDQPSEFTRKFPLHIPLLCATRSQGSTYFCLTWQKEILSPTCLDFRVIDSAGWLHGEPGKMSPEQWLKELAISFSLFYGRLLLRLLLMITTKHIIHTYWQLKLRHANQLLLKITLHLFPGWCVSCNTVLWQNSLSLTQINPWDFLPATDSALEEHIKFLNVSEN